jgi:uncharacterized protein YPO0396
MRATMDIEAVEARSGFRLHRFEVLNWGTFHKRVWSMPSTGNNSLLTGDIGSGKSTLVDGLTSLLAPPQRITFNKAAGAEARERSLRSYVRGYFKSEKDIDTLSARSVALRDGNSYSVLLAYFYNEGYGKSVTLAQVFWSRDNRNTPERFYVVATMPLSVADAFSDFGADVLMLKKRLRKEKGVRVFDTFAKYAVQLRRQMGIDNTQALDLFYQTVSMKSVGNLTDFVRRHMLEIPPVAERIEKICRQFDDLNRAHEAVLRARDQVAHLAPIVEETDRFAGIQEKIGTMKNQRGALHGYFAAKKTALLDWRIRQRSAKMEQLVARIETCRGGLDTLEDRRRQLERAISESGGRRLEEIADEIERLSRDRERITGKENTYRKLCKHLNFAFPADEVAFVENLKVCRQTKDALSRKGDDLHNDTVELEVRLKEISEKMNALEKEVLSLQKRESNIPVRNLSIREDLCAAVGLTEAELPFAGELLRVKETETAWEGAAERLLHNFGLSLLVPQDHYAKVAVHVNATHLAGRLVYLKTSLEGGRPMSPAAPDCLSRKLDIKTDTPFYDWLERELARRFKHTCCDDTEIFRRCKTAVTLAGQIKTGGVRHEKDDRYRIDDRRRYVLGWQNREKIRALKMHLDGMEKDHLGFVEKLQQLDRQRRQNTEQRDRLQSLLSFEAFAEIHWQPLARQVVALQEEKEQIEAGSDVLKALQEKLDMVISQQKKKKSVHDELLTKKARLKERIFQDKQRRQAALETLSEVEPEDREVLFPQLSEMAPVAIEEREITIETCDANQTRMRNWLQQKIENEDEKSKRSRDRAIRQMQAYKGRYPVETSEVDADMDAADAFREMLAHLQREDLPRHERRFKQKLNEETIQGMALFQGQLDGERHEIQEKIETINRSLSAIDYNDNTYILLVADDNRDVEIHQFRKDLRACLGETLTGNEDEAYTEHKFLQVKAMIDRFNGREGQTELDRRWTAKVTDVRNWMIFSVSERWREDDKEKEFYSDTAGKSGGQKEKLAYTILASALAYQFGLEWGEKKSRAFRFVMIDEAFGRGSDESTRYALELFNKLNLQLLIVTPLQKINIIEDYVSAVHYIHNPDGKNSMIRNLTIEQYREEKDAFAAESAV